MKTLSVIFDVPQHIIDNIYNGKYERVGGVIREKKTNKIIMWLRENGESTNKKSNSIEFNSTLSTASLTVGLINLGATFYYGEKTLNELNLIKNILQYNFSNINEKLNEINSKLDEIKTSNRNRFMSEIKMTLFKLSTFKSRDIDEGELKNCFDVLMSNIPQEISFLLNEVTKVTSTEMLEDISEQYSFVIQIVNACLAISSYLYNDPEVNLNLLSVFEVDKLYTEIKSKYSQLIDYNALLSAYISPIGLGVFDENEREHLFVSLKLIIDLSLENKDESLKVSGNIIDILHDCYTYLYLGKKSAYDNYGINIINDIFEFMLLINSQYYKQIDKNTKKLAIMREYTSEYNNQAKEFNFDFRKLMIKDGCFSYLYSNLLKFEYKEMSNTELLSLKQLISSQFILDEVNSRIEGMLLEYKYCYENSLSLEQYNQLFITSSAESENSLIYFLDNQHV